MYDILQLNDMILPELKDIAENLKIKGADQMEKQELILKVLDAQALNPAAPAEAETETEKPKEEEKPEKKK